MSAPDVTAAGARRGGPGAAPPGRAADLVLAAARELGPDPAGWPLDVARVVGIGVGAAAGAAGRGGRGRPGAAGEQDAPEPAQAWRDAAVTLAVHAAWRRGDPAAVRVIADAYAGLLVLVPQWDGSQVRLHPVGIAERRRRGSFATPPGLSAVLARHALPDGAAGAAAGVPRLVDPACGAGALLRAGFARLRALGAPAQQALAALHGVDADAVAATVCRAVLAVDADQAGAACTPRDLEAAIRVGDALQGPAARGRSSAGPHSSAGDATSCIGADVGRVSAGPGGAGADADGPDAGGAGADGADGAGGPGGAALVWHRAFPQVLAVPGGVEEPVTGWRGGFDAVLANPPWERLKVTGRDWGGTPPRRLREQQAVAARRLREAGRHPLTGAGELNAYLPFVETCWRLLAPRGRAGIVVPAGVAADRSAARLLAALLEGGALERLHLLATGAVPFLGVASRIGVAVLVLRAGAHPRPDPARPDPARSGAAPPPAQVAVGMPDPAQDPGERAWDLDPELPRLVNPNTGTPPLCGSRLDAALLARAHRRWPVLLRRDPADGSLRDDPWQLRLVTPFHMTRDARWFRSAPGPGLLPLWEAKHAWLLDHRGGSVPGHRYWVPEKLVQDRLGDLTARGWLAGYRNVTTVDAPRTLLPCALPVAGVGNSFPLLSAPRLPLLLAALASLPLDYLVRQKHAGANLNFFKLEQLALPGPQEYDVPAPWEPGITLAEWMLGRFAAAVAWRDGLDALAAELESAGITVPPRPRAAPDPAAAAQPTAADGRAAAEVRARALAELDAAHAVLLGWRRGELEHVLAGFGALRARELERSGRFVTADRVLAAFDRLGG